MTSAPRIVALAGGVGGARLAHGLALCGVELAVIVNVGDDFEHLGLSVSPDLDTVLYTLAGLGDEAQGWGLAGESWGFMEQVRRFGGPDWFRLGDRDLALHVLRSERLRRGETLTSITADFARRLGVTARILPATDAPLRTMVDTEAGELVFQDYFVRQRCEPRVTGFRFAGAEDAWLTPDVAAALSDPALEAVVLCPSNPYVSIDPILACRGVVEAAITARPVIGVSPIIAGRAVKGPAAKMMAELAEDVSPLGVARRYRHLLHGFLIDEADAALAPQIEAMGLQVHATDITMAGPAGRARVAEACLALARSIGPGRV